VWLSDFKKDMPSRVRFRELGSCRLEFRARDPTIPEFKTQKRSHVDIIGPECDDLIALANVCW
jgi:hypothetical protein